MDVSEVSSAIAVATVSLLLVATAILGVDTAIATYRFVRSLFD